MDVKFCKRIYGHHGSNSEILKMTSSPWVANSKCWSRGGTRGQDPPPPFRGKPQVIWVPWGCLRFVIVVFPDHTHFLISIGNKQLDPHWKKLDPHLKNVGPPREPWKIIVFFEINRLASVKWAEDYTNPLSELFFQMTWTPRTKISGSTHE